MTGTFTCDEPDVIHNSIGAGTDAYFVKEGTQEEFSDRLAAILAEKNTPDPPDLG